MPTRPGAGIQISAPFPVYTRSATPSASGTPGTVPTQVPARQPQLVSPPLRGSGGDGAVVDPDHRLRTGPDERGILQPVAALQVHHLGSAVQDVPEKAQLDGVQRGSRRGLREQVVVLTDVLARRRLPSHPVRLRHRIHAVMLCACDWRCQRLWVQLV